MKLDYFWDKSKKIQICTRYSVNIQSATCLKNIPGFHYATKVIEIIEIRNIIQKSEGSYRHDETVFAVQKEPLEFLLCRCCSNEFRNDLCYLTMWIFSPLFSMISITSMTLVA